MPREPLDLFVLDTLANDLEALEDILRMLNSDTVLGWRHAHPQPFERDEVVLALTRNIRAGLVEACAYDVAAKALVGLGEQIVPDGSMDDCWFRMTRRGRMVHDAWEPPLPGPSTGENR
jgi:hypothetical protein